jgi:hypothetical protein
MFLGHPFPGGPQLQDSAPLHPFQITVTFHGIQVISQGNCRNSQLPAQVCHQNLSVPLEPFHNLSPSDINL